MATLFVLLALSLAASCSANAYFYCDCSPTNRGYKVNTLVELRKSVSEVDELVADMKSKKLPAAEIAETETEEAIKRWKSCRNNFSAEECVNADTALRLGSCYPNCRSFCKFDEPSWENVNGDKRLPSCKKSVSLNAISPDIIAGKAERSTEFRPPAMRPSPVPVSGASTAATASDTTKNTAATATDKATGNADTTNTASTQENALPIPPENERTVSDTANSPVDGTDVVIPPVAQAESPEPEPSALPPNRVNEGCVAVEHLSGYVLQHRAHLSRAVLCSKGFCATPNHAIIVRGEWTSMKRMCKSEWNCVQAVKLVNNLKLAANRRVVVNDEITITPYDIRFPLWATWVAQMAEDVVGLVGVSVAVGAAAAAGLLVSSQL